jgi:hypothetical protein
VLLARACGRPLGDTSTVDLLPFCYADDDCLVFGRRPARLGRWAGHVLVQRAVGGLIGFAMTQRLTSPSGPPVTDD